MTLNTGQSSVYDVDTEVSLLTPTHFNGLFNRDEISIRGLLFDVDAQEERPIKVPIGSILHAYLYIGTDCVENRGSFSDVRGVDMTSDWVKFASDGDKRTEELSDEYVRGVGCRSGESLVESNKKVFAFERKHRRRSSQLL